MINNPEGKLMAIVLGGTSPHVELINKLKARGFYVCLVDYLDNPPGALVADEHIRESTLDLDKVLEIASQRNAQLVISTCIDQANSTCCYVAEKLGLPHPYSYQTSLDVTDKGRMKKIFVENGIPTSPYRIIRDDNIGDFKSFDYPAVVKPVDCNSSKGVHKVESDEEALHYLKEAISLSRTQTSIIEGFNSGEEIQVDCLALNDGGAKVIMTRKKKKIHNSDGMVLQSSGSIVPAPLSPEFKQQTEDIADSIARAFSLKNTPFFYQAIVTCEGIKVLEFAPRIGGGLSYYLIKTVTGFDPIEAAIKSFLGELVTPCLLDNLMCYSTNLLYMRPGIFDHIEGMDKLKEKGIIKDCFVMKNKGTVIDQDMRSGNRVGAFVVEAETYEALSLKEKEAYDEVEVFDVKGNKVLNRNVF